MKSLYSKVVKNNQVTYGIPFQLKVPLNYQPGRVNEKPVVINEVKAEKAEKTEKSELNFSAAIIAKAKKEADLLIDDAKYEALKIISYAEKEAGEHSAAIKEEAYKEGYEAGLEAAEKEYRSKLQEADAIKQATEAEHDRIIENMEKEIVELAMEIAKKVIGDEISLNKENMLSVVRQAIDKCSNKSNLVIRVSSEDYEYLKNNMDKLFPNAGSTDVMELKSDPSMKPGDCYVDTVFGSVDAGVQTKMAKIEKALHKILDARYK